MKPKRRSASHLILLACYAFLWLFDFRLSNAADTLTAGKVMKDWEFLESPNKMFQLLFFYPVYSSNRYLGIRYVKYDEMKIVWVANRKNPLKDTSGYLNITKDGYLVIRDEKGTSITINPGEPANGSNTSVTLLDSGNLVLKEGQRVVWQSFDHPTDTILPGMKLGLFDLKQKRPRNILLTSWVSPGSPAIGAFTLGVDPNNPKQLQVWRRGALYWHSVTWNERNLSNFPFPMGYIEGLNFSYTSNENESYFTYTLTEYNFSWIEMNSTGSIRSFVGSINTGELLVKTCNVGKENTFQGCVVSEPQLPKCSDANEFVSKLGSMNSWRYLNNFSLGLGDCERICTNDCSCKAYGSGLPDGSGCRFSDGNMIDSYPDLPESFYLRHKEKGNRLLIGLLLSLGLFALACFLYLIWKICSKGKRGSSQNQVGRYTEQLMKELGTSMAAIDGAKTHNLMLQGKKEPELAVFRFSSIEAATGHFSEANKLGQGGFGPVYKGDLVDGQEIAVKRLSDTSRQGAEEFKNEVVLISKVQHRNLVRLFGCCIKGDEKLLIYEYLPNKSLDTFLFDEMKRLLLDWIMRMNIIEGIAQGLLYLHKYSRLKIIHRDLKTSNILLDNNMNPKISDFGTAKIFRENESRANTNRIVGTYGYMSPEYAMDGLFSVKSDVFSFGVMMLEIISGKKNTGFYQSNHSSNLVRYAWSLWKEERSLELMDSTLAETCSTNEFVKCVQVALLCVQENAADRPTMSDVVSMLGSDVSTLPQPKQSSVSTLPTMPDNSRSINDVTLSSTHAR